MSFVIDDLGLFFLDFAVDVEWASGSSSSGPFKGIFDDEYTFLDASTGEIETSSPQVLVKSSEVVGVQHGTSRLLPQMKIMIQ